MLKKLFGWMFRKVAIAGTASITTFCSVALLIKVKSRDVLSPGDSMTSVLVGDHEIFGCVDVDVVAETVFDVAALGAVPGADGGAGGLARRNTEAASTSAGTMIHAIHLGRSLLMI